MSNNTKSNKRLHAPMALKLIRLGFRFGGQLAPMLAGRIAYKLWFTPARIQTPASEKKALKSAEIEYLQINSHTIATYSWGQTGPAVLLVHGWGGRGTQLGSFVKPLLDAGYRILSFDAPAHGKSSGKQTNLYEVADTLLALQHHHGLFDAVITHSFGGPCIAMAVQKGFKTKRIISISPPATTKGLVEKFRKTLDIPEKVGKNLMQRIET
ncbi:MAG TPA: alpha/beta hydrolase, partial [Gammaproteobacteria bacterium]